MKIAVITDDGKLISQHFGRAAYYLVCTIEDGKVTAKEMRDKLGHTHLSNESHGDNQSSAGRGMDPASHDKHLRMADVISDCTALICGGMGMGAYNSMRSLNIQPIVTDQSDIDEVVQAYINGSLIDHSELLH